jgi:thiamine-phosphate pyrophosphorylase
MTKAERLAKFDRPGLYVVITEAYCAGRSSLDVLDAVLAADVKLIQFREKDWDDSALFERARAFRERTAKAGALLIIDDRVDIALAVEADGVHLGQDDLPIPAAHAIAAELIVGASTHNLDEAMRAQSDGADYANIGPIFSTQTKETGFAPLGPEAIDAIAPHLTIPWTTMGGIKLHNINEVLSRGARRAAVVTAVTAADDVEGAARELNARVLDAASNSGRATAE